jgi:glycosyltransferase involved in cell wall biosynthesis
MICAKNINAIKPQQRKQPLTTSHDADENIPTKMHMETALMIAYFFPPISGSGVYRTLKFVIYLPQCGWRPIVVCGDDARSFGFTEDPSLLCEVPPEARVVRRPFVSPLGLRRRLQRLFRVQPTVPAEFQPNHDEGLAIKAPDQDWPKAGNVLRLLGKLLYPIEHPPIGPAFYWALSILPTCLRLIRQEKVDLIYTTSDPYSDHFAGYLLKRLTGKPWVADFRDPWTQTWNYSNKGWRRWLDRWAEKRVLQTADRVIGVTPSETQGLHDLAPRCEPGRFITIENGYDEADYSSNDDEPAGGERPVNARVTLAHVGILYDGTALPLLQALDRLGQAGDRLHVRFVGGLPDQEQRWLGEHPLSTEIEIFKRVPHPEALRHMAAADVLLLIMGSGERWGKHYPGKLFEYMRSGHPILLIGPEGDASQLLAYSGTGTCVDPGDIDGLVGLLRLIIEGSETFSTRYYRPVPAVIQRYERRALTAKLAAVFNDACGPEGPAENA